MVGSVSQASGVFLSFGCPKAGPPLTFYVVLRKGLTPSTSLKHSAAVELGRTSDT